MVGTTSLKEFYIFCDDRGSKHDLTVPNTHAQNTILEIKNFTTQKRVTLKSCQDSL